MFRKKSLSNLLLSALVFMCICCFSVFAPGQRGRDLGKPATELEAKLLMYKDQYLLREPIWIKMKVTNIGEQEGWFYFCTRGCLEIKDSKGKVYQSQVASSLSPVTIKPDETLEYEFNILGCFGAAESKFRLRYYLPVEKYSIIFKLTENVSSEAYQFEILKPKDNELKAMNLLKQSYDLLVKKESDFRLKALDKIIKNYPNSVYAPKAYYERSLVYGITLRDFNEKLNTFSKLVEGYPNSREAVHSLTYIVDTYINKKDKTGVLNYLENLIKDNPNTAVAIEAEKQLEKLDELKFE